MPARITLSLSPELVEILRRQKSVTINLTAAKGRKRARTGVGMPRAGSLPARVVDWAEKRKRPFTTADAERRFKLSRAHASMVLSRLASGPYPVRRKCRGVYEHCGR